MNKHSKIYATYCVTQRTEERDRMKGHSQKFIIKRKNCESAVHLAHMQWWRHLNHTFTIWGFSKDPSLLINVDWLPFFFYFLWLVVDKYESHHNSSQIPLSINIRSRRKRQYFRTQQLSTHPAANYVQISEAEKDICETKTLICKHVLQYFEISKFRMVWYYSNY